MKQLIYIMSLFALVCGCSSEESLDSPSSIVMKISTPYTNETGVLTGSSPDNEVNTLSGYICENGIVKWVSHNLQNTSGDVWLPSEYKGGTLYLLANKSQCPQADDIVKGSLENELTSLNAVLNDYRAPSSLLMANVIDIPTLEASENIAINLQRNVARFDLSFEKSVVIHSISINGIPVSGRVFSSGSPSALVDTQNLNLTFTEDQPAMSQCLFYCQELVESVQPAMTITVDATFNGLHAKAQSTLRSIRRNYLYRLQVSAPNGIITSDITYADLESGDDVAVDKPLQIPIAVDPARSELPANCKLSDDKRKLYFDYHGGKAVIAFEGDAPMKLMSSHGAIRDFSVTSQADGRFLIYAGESLTELGTDSPAAIMYFAAEEDEKYPSRYQAIVVQSEYFAPFDVVTIGGTEWSQINAQGDNQNYLITEKNHNYRELYKSKWRQFSAQGNQWGPRPGDANGKTWRYAAGDQASNLPYPCYPYLANINGAIIGGNNCKTWNGPCPTGWRLPKSEEFARIWPPNGTTLTEGSAVSYTTVFGQFTASIEGLGNKCVIISDGTNEVIFPIAGVRSPNGVDPTNQYTHFGWNIGMETYYWCYDRTSANGLVYGIKNKVTVVGARDAASWDQVRCVRDI